MNLADILVAVLVAVILAAAVFFTIRNRRGGKNGCTGCRAYGECSRKCGQHRKTRP